MGLPCPAGEEFGVGIKGVVIFVEYIRLGVLELRFKI